MEIKILGTGCPKCKHLEMITKDVITEEGIDAEVNKVEDMMEIMSYGIVSTPGLVVDGKVKVSGRVPSKDEIKKMLT